MSNIERDKVAKVLYTESPPEFDYPWERATDEEREPYYEAADAVLRALDYQGSVDEAKAALRWIASNADVPSDFRNRHVRLGQIRERAKEALTDIGGDAA
jgi:hypothetical protein